ncbi:retropepsin-like aspartic protease family protein [Marinobacterium sp. YM272]|uniref:retropepsin-like aspartic protease family protein n=1 Tax=Marinobacterium sp. YM272 TaxID=3421654 RepID=UPI003D7FC6D4
MYDPDRNRRRMGRLMTHLTWVAILAMLTLFFNNYIESRDNPNADLAYLNGKNAEVVLERNRAGHYLAPGRINGERVQFLLDTGATTVSVPATLAEELGLERGRAMQSMTANGVVRVYRTTLDSVTLGGIHMNNVSATINPGMHEDLVLLGMSFMQHLEMTQRDGTLTLRVPAGR